ncbi:MAG: 5-amino-6-(D-ribitylamino)uracil--L-tyrosine 4-hydroxyphenyl transferase CofH [Massilia sp.]
MNLLDLATADTFDIDALLDSPLDDILKQAEQLTLAGHGSRITYSPKVFIPLTQLCRDVCHYCTFAKAPKAVQRPYLSIEEAVSIAKAGVAADCHEALFTLGDKPELRYEAAREALAEMGYATTLEYLEAAAKAVYEATGLLPHLNPGLMSRDEMIRLRKVSASMGIMLESNAQRLCARGGPHYGSPDKDPAARLETIRLAGELSIPFTTGLLIGIGETRGERISSLLDLRALHRQYGHIQEIIIQNFRAKAGTNMAGAPEPSLEEHLWTIAVARLIFGPDMSIQAPPNLQPDTLPALLRAGVNDWGGISPVTKDHVNPERPWPHLDTLRDETVAAGRHLLPRLALGARYALDLDRWVDPSLHASIRRRSDAFGLARGTEWFAGAANPVPAAAKRWLGSSPPAIGHSAGLTRILDRAWQGTTLDKDDIVRLFETEGTELSAVLHAADALRHEAVGDTVTYVINRNINYTNICSYRCGFCAFAKGQGGKAKELRGPAYLLDMEEVARRAQEAYDAGASEVCLQGGIHPSFTGHTYLEIVRAVKKAVPNIHVHAFSPLEIHHGADTLGMPLADYLSMLRDAGLASLPGTAAEILHDDVRRLIAPDKLDTDGWLEVIAEAHKVGLRTTSTIMFGHVEQPGHWADHLLHLRRLQERSGGITEFVPLPYVHMEAPLWRKGLSRSGPTFREAVLMHAVGRLTLFPHIKNVQTSWVKMGLEGAVFSLQAGANDLGGTLMNESITRAAGGINGQELGFAEMERLAGTIGRPSQQRTALYEPRNISAVRQGQQAPVACGRPVHFLAQSR